MGSTRLGHGFDRGLAFLSLYAGFSAHAFVHDREACRAKEANWFQKLRVSGYPESCIPTPHPKIDSEENCMSLKIITSLGVPALLIGTALIQNDASAHTECIAK